MSCALSIASSVPHPALGKGLTEAPTLNQPGSGFQDAMDESTASTRSSSQGRIMSPQGNADMLSPVGPAGPAFQNPLDPRVQAVGPVDAAAAAHGCVKHVWPCIVLLWTKTCLHLP